jgi:hypothetical protein
VHAGDGNGLAPRLSQRTITKLAEDYTETTYRLNQEGVDIESASLDADLRRRLAEMVLPEFIEVEFERVATCFGSEQVQSIKLNLNQS